MVKKTPIDSRFKFAIELGKRFKELRLEAGVSRETLSEALGYLDYTSIYHWESGRSCLPTWAIPTVCELLKCTPEKLLGMKPRAEATGLGPGPFKVGTGGVLQDEEMLKADRDANRLIGERLRAYRKMRKITLEELAEETNIGISALSRAETGQRRVSASQIIPLAKALGVTVGQILGTEKL